MTHIVLKEFGLVILSVTGRGFNLFPVWFRLLLEAFWLLAFKKSEKLILFLSSIKCLKYRDIYLVERMGISWKMWFICPAAASELVGWCLLFLSNVVETEPQNTQQKHMLFQMKQRGPFKKGNSVPLLVPCVACERFSEAKQSRTPVSFFFLIREHTIF